MRTCITILLLVAGAITCCAQETENWFKRWIKGDLILLTAGYQVPLYGQAGKRFTDPLVAYSRQNLVFIPMLSTEIKKGFGLDFRFSYLQSSRWLKEMKNNLQSENAGAIVSTYATSKYTQMRVWNIMTGPSYRFSKGRSIWSFNLLVGFGNQPIKTIAADVKTRGTNELVTWDVAEIRDLTKIRIYKNIFIGSAGLKYIFCFHSKWGVSASCDMMSSQREVSYFVTRTVQHTGEISEYTVRVTRPGFSLTPGIGLVRHF